MVGNVIVGVDIGGTNCDVVCYNGNFRHILTLKTSETDIYTIFRKIAESLASDEVNEIHAGVGIAAWMLNGKPVHAPNLEMGRFWIDETVVEVDGVRFFVDVIDNDANCFAYFARETLGKNNLLAVTVGTGIGGGIVWDGDIVRGRGMAGEIGHTKVSNERICRCGGVGCVEAYFGGWAFREYEGVSDVERFVGDGEVYTISGFREFCRAVSNAVMLLNPESVVFGGRIGSRLEIKKIKDCICEFLPEVFLPELHVVDDDYAVAKGAASLVRASRNP